MDNNKDDKIIKKSEPVGDTCKNEAALEILSDIYDLYDAQR